MERLCGECALKSLKGGMCPIFDADMSEQHGCPYFTTTINYCNLCGAPIIGKVMIEEDDGSWHIFCQRCATASPCETCKNSYCAFEQDGSCQEPPYVMAQMRQGNMVVQQQVMNPKRVEATCRKGCPCFDEDGLDSGTFCKRKENCGCNKHKMNWRN